jgi:hypothetical protein
MHNTQTQAHTTYTPLTWCEACHAWEAQRTLAWCIVWCFVGLSEILSGSPDHLELMVPLLPLSEAASPGWTDPHSLNCALGNKAGCRCEKSPMAPDSLLWSVHNCNDFAERKHGRFIFTVITNHTDALSMHFTSPLRHDAQTAASTPGKDSTSVVPKRTHASFHLSTAAPGPKRLPLQR